jgi:hypothetical protein
MGRGAMGHFISLAVCPIAPHHFVYWTGTLHFPTFYHKHYLYILLWVKQDNGRKKPRMANKLNLPLQILWNIVSYLDFMCLFRLEQVCKKLQNILVVLLPQFYRHIAETFRPKHVYLNWLKSPQE